MFVSAAIPICGARLRFVKKSRLPGGQKLFSSEMGFLVGLSASLTALVVLSAWVAAKGTKKIYFQSHE